MVDQGGTPVEVDAELHDGSTEAENIARLNGEIAQRKRAKRELSGQVHASDTRPDVLKKEQMDVLSSEVAELQNKRRQTIDQRNKRKATVPSPHPEAQRLRSLRSYKLQLFFKKLPGHLLL